MNKCPTCSNIFDTERGLKVHHKIVHGESLVPEIECEVCGDKFRTSEPDRRKTCSKSCKGKKTAERQSGDGHWNWKGGNLESTCENCGDEFTHKRSDDRKVCSWKCSKEYISQEMSGENHHNFQGVTKKCENCGDEFRTTEADYNRRTTCSKSCMGELMSTEYNPRWKPGRNGNYGPEWDELSDKIREQKDKCKLCGEEKGYTMPVHHIIPVRAFKDKEDAHYENNTVLLCRSCHGKVEWWDIPKQVETFNTDPTNIEL